jgi:hypothetical protein
MINGFKAKGQEIKQNSIFIIEGYSQSQNIILGLNKKHNIYLKSGSRKIKLLVTKILVGQFSLTQALLKPEFVLQAGLEYTMYIDNMPEYETLTNYNRKTYEHEVVKYKVLPENDIEKPRIASKPKEIKKTLVHYGCGPSIHVVFSNPSKDKSEIIIMTTLKNLNTKKEVSYFIEPQIDKIKVGHGMCSGAFDFEGSDNYEVEFSFMDSSGNITPWTGERIKFSKPTKETNSEDE